VTAIVAALRTGARREHLVDHDEVLSLSRFTIPVSLIVPSTSADANVSSTIAALLALNYPELEVIVVLEQTQGESFDALAREWQLDAREFFYRRSIETAPVRRIYRSARDARVIVIDKTAAGQADAINCGVNMARYRYVAVVPPAIAFDANALLRLMAAPLLDPARVIGASNHIERSGLFERMGSARARMMSRLLWRSLRYGIGPSSAVTVWRRDAVLSVNGFSTRAADPHLDMARRALRSNVERRAGHFHRGASVFGRTAPRTIISTLAAAGRRQIGVLQFLPVLSPSGVRTFGARSLACFWTGELLIPLAQIWIIAASIIGAAIGVFPWTMVLFALLLLSFGQAAFTTAALFMRSAAADAPDEPELVRLLLASPLEIFFYRPALIVAGLFAGQR
jgi:hypothetical protein